jgi:uncharacterized protein (DUF433 family)
MWDMDKLAMKNYRDRICISPNIRIGKPCILNTRIAVSDVFDYLGEGMSVEEVLDDFPDLTLVDIQACFAFAADRDRRCNRDILVAFISKYKEQIYLLDSNPSESILVILS